MSGIFRNLSNSGVARFRNLSNSGRGIFYGPSTPIGPGETTTTTTTTSTTTTSTTTTPVVLNPVTYGYNISDADQACTNYETNVFVTKYNNNNDASGNDVVVWNNSNGTGVPSDGYYARGINVWYMTNGVLGNQAICYSGTTSTTTTTTTAAPASNWQHSAIRCATGATVTVISTTQLTRFSTYTTSPSGQSECYTITTIGTTTSDPPTNTFYSTVTDCSDNTRCVQG